MTVGNRRKSLALIAGLFVFHASPLFSAETSTTTDDCKPSKLDLIKEASIVYDGSSFLIENDYVVLTGVHVPSPGRTAQREETGGKLAAEMVGKWIKEAKGKVGLELDALPSEEGRVLTHLYLPNGRNLAEMLLERGFAFVNTQFPNTKHVKCYRDAEARARAGKKGIWQYMDRGVPVVESKNLTSDRDQFQIVRGRVVLAREGSGYYILNMDTLGIRIPNSELSRFSTKSLSALMGKTIEVRGHLKYHQGSMFVRILHPGQIDLLADELSTNNSKSTKK